MMILLELFFIIIYLLYKLLHCLPPSPSALHVLPTGLCQPRAELPSPEQMLDALSEWDWILQAKFRVSPIVKKLLKAFKVSD